MIKDKSIFIKNIYYMLSYAFTTLTPSCLEFFIQNRLVHASSWTNYGNPREYALYPSLQEFLFNCPHEIMEELQKVKDAYYLELPF